MNKERTNGIFENGLVAGGVNYHFREGGENKPGEKSALVFVSLPRKKGWEANAAPAIAGLPVYCERPPTHLATTHANANIQKETTSSAAIAYRLLPLTVLLATVFAATGMFRALVQGVSMPSYYPAGYLKTQSWRNGSGPSPLDAVKNNYQNALTREMVAAKDTGARIKMAMADTKKRKGPETGINVSTSRYRGTAKKGLHNLTLRIFNGTNDRLDRISLEVEFLDKQGRRLNTETYTLGDLGPQREKQIVVPEGTPGVKVQYRINEVRTKAHTTRLQSI